LGHGEGGNLFPHRTSEDNLNNHTRTAVTPGATSGLVEEIAAEPPEGRQSGRGGPRERTIVFARKYPLGSPTLTGAFAFGFSGAVGGGRGFTLLGAWKPPKPARGLDVCMVLDKDEG
jgi:hypothetical protein